MRKKMSGRGDGFTLIELIVVIAILAILSGIGGVAYSGYIKKANQAADDVLLSAVNTAFASACLENGTRNTVQHDVTLESGSTITSVSGTSDDTAIPASFMRYFAGNDGVLKYYKNNGDIIFYNGMFMAQGADGVTHASWQVDGQTFTMTFSNADVAAVNSSTFVAEGLGVDTLLKQVNDITTLATSVLNTNSGGTGSQLISGIMCTEEFAKFVSEKLGGELTAEEALTAVKAYNGDTTAQAEIYGEGGWSEEKKAVLSKLSGGNLLSNALVLYAAEQSDGLSTDADFLAELKGMDIKGTAIGADGKATSSDDMLTLGLKAYAAMYGEGGSTANGASAMAKAAYGYGMSIAYGNYKAQAGNSEVTWAEYLDSEQGKADLAAYASCMDMINSNAASSDATAALLNSGFADEGLIGAINAALQGN